MHKKRISRIMENKIILTEQSTLDLNDVIDIGDIAQYESRLRDELIKIVQDVKGMKKRAEEIRLMLDKIKEHKKQKKVGGKSADVIVEDLT
ncbi:hypothetical protein [Mycobacteroides abscessus]|uniref:hypothetical protein n=1 Tax=Mycobacteroides abscessus TaxID=36809 RepID=UPI000C26508B|nr:hypothetical protein [Mycobacteroides abscessus]